MNEPWFPVAVVLLLALLVGFAVPALLQLRRTLRSAETFLDTTGRELDVVLRETGDAAKRVNGLTVDMAQSLGRARDALESFKDIVDSARRLRDTLRTVSAVLLAVGPAILAAMQGFAARSGDGDRAGTEPPPAEVPRPSAAASTSGTQEEPA